ncbi:extracellular solute-binding protein [Allorhizocola rhizosphaerae]|uniref:extracellular solute-binding protein n=1 Tax=Allorhizocola rhizosphaerae TaxID=1872709 RepID=UPI000E3E9092|nr:extracellular solute-binding protein [Allorhizocola rhizosphaerae]
MLALLMRYRGWAGLGAGVVIGALATLLVTSVVQRAPGGLEPGTLIILSGRDDGLGGQRQALVDQWNALPGRPRAEIVVVAGEADAHHAQMLGHAQSGGADVDVFNLDITWIAEFAKNGYLRPIPAESVDTSGFLAKPLEACHYEGKLWALPFNTDAGLLFYRSDLIPGDPPNSWPLMQRAIDDVFAGPHPPELVAGFTGQLGDYEGLTVNAFEAIWAADGEVVGSDGTVVVDSPQARDGLRRLAAGLSPGRPQQILPESVNFNETSSRQAFHEGKVVFMRNWPVSYRLLGDPPKVKFQTTVLPRGSVLGGQNLAVSSRSDQPRAARELIEFLTSERSQQILFERGGFAATRELVYQDREVQAKHPYAQTLLNAVRQARLRPVTPHYSRFSAEFRAGVRYALAHGGEMPPGFEKRLTEALEGRV